MDTTIHTNLASLRSMIAGPVVGAGDDGYDAARQAFVLSVDQRPAGVVLPRSAEELATAVRFARDAGLRIAVQSTGHGALPLGSLEDTLLVKTINLNGLEIDAAGRRARAEAGVLWGDVAVAAGAEGLAALHGSSPTVGVVGYTLGGGIGWLSRRYGLASNSVLAIEVVTAGGEQLRVDAENEPELFWALRGGGGAFAAVTAIEFRLYPVDDLYAGMLVFDAGEADAVVHAYREWSAGVPDELTSVIRFLTLPPLPDVPEPLRGRPVITIGAAHLAGEAEAGALLRPLREVAPLVMDTFAPLAPAELRTLHGDPEQPVPALSGHVPVRELSAEAADAFIAVAGPGSGSPLVSVELRQLGGALAEAPQGAGALGAIDAGFALFGVGMPMDDDSGRAIGSHLARVSEAMRPHAAELQYLNFADQLGEAEGAFEAGTWSRLREVKARYDGGDLFQSNHPVRADG